MSDFQVISRVYQRTQISISSEDLVMSLRNLQCLASTPRFFALLTAVLASGPACGPGGSGPTEPDNVGLAAVAPEGRSQPAAAAVVHHEVVINQPTEILQFIDCANGGLGEEILFTGSLHLITHMTISGNRVSVFEVAAFHETGTGLSTGDKYESTVAYRWQPVSGSLVNGQFLTAFVAHAAITGPGPGNNMYFPLTFHITINANGEVTAEVERGDFTCK
jgi:hypothetical protein